MNRQAFVIVPPPGMKVILQNQVLSPVAINHPPGSMQNGDWSLQTKYQTNLGFTEETGTAGNKCKGHVISVQRGNSKVLGAIQILIGLVHLTFGSLLFIFSGLYMSYIMYSRYLYWGGILFIFSGSILVVADHYQVSSVLKGSLALNTISSVAAAVGIFLFLVDILNFPGDQYEQHAGDWEIVQALSDTLLFFAILEFLIGIAASRSSYNALYHQDDEAICLMTEEEEKLYNTMRNSSANSFSSTS